MVEHAFNPNTREVEAEAGRSLLGQGQPGLYNEFQSSQGYKVRPRLRKTKSSK